MLINFEHLKTNISSPKKVQEKIFRSFDPDIVISSSENSYDLENYTNIHRLLQVLLNLRETKWFHHKLVKDTNGKRIAKRSNSKLTIKELRKNGYSAKEVIKLAKSST